MWILFLHQNFPAQFGQIAAHLAKNLGYRCTFVSQQEIADSAEIQQIRFQTDRGATKDTHHCSRTFENQIWRSHAVFETLRSRADIRPDLIVAHSGFVSPLYLRELFPSVPQISYFEFFYHAHDSDLDFRHDLPPVPQIDLLRARTRNAMLLLDLENCDAGYSPTEFQRSQLPACYQPKLTTIFDGIDTQFWKPIETPKRRYGHVELAEGQRVVTYVSRGFESIRGGDIFLQVADRICRARNDVQVVVVGEDRIAYGGDSRFTGGKTFRQWAIDRYQPDLSRIHFIGRLPPSQLVHLLSLSDLHMYWTVPFVLSWSLLNALSCKCLLLASDTAPVREVVQHQHSGMLIDFFDIDAWVDRALQVLDHPNDFATLRTSARATIENKYSLPVCSQQMVQLYQQVANLPRHSN